MTRDLGEFHREPTEQKEQNIFYQQLALRREKKRISNAEALAALLPQKPVEGNLTHMISFFSVSEEVLVIYPQERRVRFSGEDAMILYLLLQRGKEGLTPEQIAALWGRVDYANVTHAHMKINDLTRNIPQYGLAISGEPIVLNNTDTKRKKYHIKLTPYTLHENSEQYVTVAGFDSVFEEYRGRINNYIYHLVGNKEQADDFTQDTFLKAYRALSTTYIEVGKFSSWLYTIARNTVFDANRRKKLIGLVPLSSLAQGIEDADADYSDHSPVLEDEHELQFENRIADRELINHILNRMSGTYAQILWFSEYEHFSTIEIAGILNISPSAVKMRLMRAREAFRNLYRIENQEEKN